ncbi:MAG: hypothetical protein ACOZBZ_01940 [Patescibacteria group bacterium]
MKIIILFAFFLRLILAFGPYHPDLGNHLDWGKKFWEVGPGRFYEYQFWQVSWPNQPPGTIYLFAFVHKISEVIFNLIWWLNVAIPVFPSFLVPFIQEKLPIILVKLPSILADLGIAWVIYLIVKKLKDEKLAKLATVVFIFNPVTFYNSSIWGQTDAIINFFALLGLYFLLIRKPILGMSSFIFSLYFKTSLIIFLPIFLLLVIREKYSLVKIVFAFIVPVLVIAIISLPFSAVAHYNVFKWLYSDLYLTRVFGHQGNMLTANAFNFWALLFGIDLAKTDLGKFLWFNFRQWGQLIFSPLLVFLLFFLWYCFSWRNVVFVLSLVAFSAFLFLTNMHERYLYPVFPLVTILLVFYPKILPLFLLLSFIHLANLYHLWGVPALPLIVIRLFSLVNLVIFGWLLASFFRFSTSKRV